MQPAIAVPWMGILIFLLLQSTDQSQGLNIDDNDALSPVDGTLDKEVDEEYYSGDYDNKKEYDLPYSDDYDNGGVSRKEEKFATIKDVNVIFRQLKTVMQAVQRNNKRIQSLIHAQNRKGQASKWTNPNTRECNNADFYKKSSAYIWDINRCSNIDPIFDSKTVTLDATESTFNSAGGDQICHAVRRDLKVSRGTPYTMTVDFTPLKGNGWFGFIFNFLDDINYDFAYVAVGRAIYHGSVKKGVLTESTEANIPSSLKNKEWYSLRIDVFKDKKVALFFNGKEVQRFMAYFTTNGYGGVAVPNGYSSIGQFRDFDVAPILSYN